MKSTNLLLLTATSLVFVTGCGGAPGSSGNTAGSGDPDVAAVAEALGVDPSDCETDITAELGSNVKAGTSLPLSGGPAAAFAPVADGMKTAILEAAERGDGPTTFKLIVKDDQFLPDKALAAAQELVQKDQVDAMAGIPGTSQVLAVAGALGDACVPLIGASGGGTVVFDAEEYPWVVPVTQPFKLDTRIWVEHVNKTHPGGAKIAVFTGNTETGKEYAKTIDEWLKETSSKSEVVVNETIEAADAAAPTSQLTTMRNSGAEVLMAAPTGAQCISLLTELANQGWQPETYLTSTCGATSYMAAAGDAGDGVMVNLYVKDPASPRWSDDPELKAVTDAVKEHVPGAEVNATMMSGYTYSEALLKAAEGAVGSEAGLSRIGLLDAARQLDYHPAAYLEGINVKLDGLEDQYAVEASELNAWSTADGVFEAIELYDFEGQLTP